MKYRITAELMSEEGEEKTVRFMVYKKLAAYGGQMELLKFDTVEPAKEERDDGLDLDLLFLLFRE